MRRKRPCEVRGHGLVVGRLDVEARAVRVLRDAARHRAAPEHAVGPRRGPLLAGGVVGGGARVVLVRGREGDFTFLEA